MRKPYRNTCRANGSLAGNQMRPRIAITFDRHVFDAISERATVLDMSFSAVVNAMVSDIVSTPETSS